MMNPNLEKLATDELRNQPPRLKLATDELSNQPHRFRIANGLYSLQTTSEDAAAHGHFQIQACLLLRERFKGIQLCLRFA